MATLPGSLGASRSSYIVANQLSGTQESESFQQKMRRHQLADVGKTTSSAELQPLHCLVNTTWIELNKTVNLSVYSA